MIVWCRQFYAELTELIAHGGIVLWVMLLLSVVLYGFLASSWFGLLKLRGQISELSSIFDHCSLPSDVVRVTGMAELDQLAWVERRIPVIAVMISLAPLAGLLGTVSGMLTTFAGLASQASQKPIDSISSGISEALITTQAGLFMAIPAAFLFALLKSRIEQVKGKIEQSAASRIIAMSASAA